MTSLKSLPKSSFYIGDYFSGEKSNPETVCPLGLLAMNACKMESMKESKDFLNLGEKLLGIPAEMLSDLFSPNTQYLISDKLPNLTEESTPEDVCVLLSTFIFIAIHTAEIPNAHIKHWT